METKLLVWFAHLRKPEKLNGIRIRMRSAPEVWTASISSSTLPARTLRAGVGPILAKEGGMLAKLLTPFKMGMGGKVGSGKQYISWIALEDAVNAIKLAIDDQKIHGPLNVVSPNPVTNEVFTKTLGHVLNRPTALALPAFAARLAFGEMADEMLLVSQRVMPKRLNAAGFQFRYPELASALQHYLAN